MTNTLEQLAMRVEQAAGLDRDIELDKAIALTIGYLREPNDFIAPHYSVPPIPNYTASLDAAMTLVPDDFDWSVHRHKLAEQASAHVYLVKEATPARTFAATPALALCAAALRARGQQ